MSRRRQSTTRRVLVAPGGFILCVLGIVASGCARSPLRPDDPRSQFDRYDRVRYEDVPAYSENEYGERTPNLRARLLRVE